MKLNTDLFAHVGFVKSKETDGEVSHEIPYDFPSFSLYFSRETGLGCMYAAFVNGTKNTSLDGLIFLKSSDMRDAEELLKNDEYPDDFSPHMALQKFIYMFYDPDINENNTYDANHLGMDPPLTDQLIGPSTISFGTNPLNNRHFGKVYDTTEDVRRGAGSADTRDPDEAFADLFSNALAGFILEGDTSTEDWPANYLTEGLWLKGLTEVSNAGFIGDLKDGIFVLKKDVEAEIDTETKTVTINGNVYEGRMSKTEFDTNADAPEYQDVVLNDDVFDVQSLSVLYFAKK